MKTINIHGKQYVPVSERLKYFRENYKDYSLITDIIELTENRVVMKSIVKDKNGREISNGHAYEILGSTNVNKTSFLENCETSANGRALANLGIMIEDNISSADEVINAIKQQNKKVEKQKLSIDKFKAMKQVIKKGDIKVVENRMANYKLTKKQETELLRLINEVKIASQI
ncbi:MAG: hypothetical protein Unbinned4026contig1003_42 [Prokaryotic dsDNA virus sp.]|nr:MAG: hypothetical protein Unbinned4026contig1003_42 [Prokaryotic dsDNA virus sp.]|tara:strand:- start:3116 stop:3631 length:516 start_codon:yes stop_codon:yes gene_type:complete